MTTRPPTHCHRPRNRKWTAAERLGKAQVNSLRYRAAQITLPRPPWVKEPQKDARDA